MGRRTASGLASLARLDLYPQSVVDFGDAAVGLARGDVERLAVLAPPRSPLLATFEGDRTRHGDRTLVLCPADATNLDTLRALLPWLRPRTLELTTSVGLGDRLGLATPGHIEALRAVGGSISPVFAQQSIREMERTGRTPQEVMDDATWGVFAEGWREGFGADADHLKTVDHVDSCVAAGYTFFTFDPGEHVNDRAESADSATLQNMVDELPWELLEDNKQDLMSRYAGRNLDIEGHKIILDDVHIARAAAKYGKAVAHTVALYRHLKDAMADRPFEVEVSVDETDSPTTHIQHVYIAGELSRLGVQWVSLAPRYVGRFEKGVDYIGSLEEFERDFAVHAAVARRYGPYKLSLHSGSDKFSVYPVAVRHTRGMVHLKTAGTSYLEALRTLATLDPPFFRELYAFSRERFEEDRASYHISASLDKAAAPEEVADARLPDLLERFDEREILHVTFGSVLKRQEMRERLMSLLQDHQEEYAGNLKRHFSKHLETFSRESEKQKGALE